jgi:hypothetical protein
VNETALDILHRAGLSPFESARVMRHAVAMAADVASDAATFMARPPLVAGEEVVRGSPNDVRAQPAQRYPLEATRVLQHQRNVQHDSPSDVAALPAQRFPRIVETAEALSEHDDPDAYCAFAVDFLLAGIEALAARAGSVVERAPPRQRPTS